MTERKFNTGDKVTISKTVTKDGAGCSGEVCMYHNINGTVFYDVKLDNKKFVFGFTEKMLKFTK